MRNEKRANYTIVLFDERTAMVRNRNIQARLIPDSIELTALTSHNRLKVMETKKATQSQ